MWITSMSNHGLGVAGVSQNAGVLVVLVCVSQCWSRSMSPYRRVWPQWIDGHYTICYFIVCGLAANKKILFPCLVCLIMLNCLLFMTSLKHPFYFYSRCLLFVWSRSDWFAISSNTQHQWDRDKAENSGDGRLLRSLWWISLYCGLFKLKSLVLNYEFI